MSAHLTDAPPAWRDITIYHLLTHTAGLAPLGDDFKSMVWTTNVKTLSLYAAAKADAMAFAPGEKWQYSDQGYFLLGRIIEKTSGKTYRQFLKERIFQPLEMTATTTINQAEVIPHLAAGYTQVNGTLYRYARLYIECQGTVGTGINFSAHIAQKA